jgi:hypothetical protein
MDFAGTVLDCARIIRAAMRHWPGIAVSAAHSPANRRPATQASLGRKSALKDRRELNAA